MATRPFSAYLLYYALKERGGDIPIHGRISTVNAAVRIAPA